MRGVDVVDQLRASYPSQTQSHNWWHWVFWFFVDISIVNMYVDITIFTQIVTNVATNSYAGGCAGAMKFTMGMVGHCRRMDSIRSL